MKRKAPVPQDPNNDPDWYQGGKQCTATSKRTKQRCRAPAAYGTNVCRKHGARAAIVNSLPDAPQRKHGRYAKLPSGLAERIERIAIEDARNRLSLEPELTLMDALIEEQGERVDAGPNRSMWRELRTLWTKFEVAMVAGDSARMQEAFALISNLIDEGNRDSAARERLESMIEKRRRLAESEQRRVTQAKEMIRYDDMVSMMQKFIAVLEDNIKDTGIMKKIAIDLERALRDGVARAEG